jgi:hypothetical protein
MKKKRFFDVVTRFGSTTTSESSFGDSSAKNLYNVFDRKLMIDPDSLQPETFLT